MGSDNIYIYWYEISKTKNKGLFYDNRFLGDSFIHLVEFDNDLADDEKEYKIIYRNTISKVIRSDNCCTNTMVNVIDKREIKEMFNIKEFHDYVDNDDLIFVELINEEY